MYIQQGFPGGASGKEPACQHRRCKRRGFSPWVRKIPWRRARPCTPVFQFGESHGQRSLVGYTPQGRKESDASQRLSTHPRTSNNISPLQGNTTLLLLIQRFRKFFPRSSWNAREFTSVAQMHEYSSGLSPPDSHSHSLIPQMSDKNHF